MLEYSRYTFERLITSESIVDVYHDTIILTLGLFLIFAFRKPVSKLLARLKSHESSLFGKNLLNPEADDESGSLKAGKQTLHEKIDRSKSAHFYWLGSDLMDFLFLLAAVDSRFKSKSEMSLVQIRHHFLSAGLKNEEIEKDLDGLIERCRKSTGSEWRSNESRVEARRAILSIRSRISSLVELNAGPEFTPWAKENRP